MYFEKAVHLPKRTLGIGRKAIDWVLDPMKECIANAKQLHSPIICLQVVLGVSQGRYDLILKKK